jgi:asparagine synthase (glutamine-hydrolysing)
VVGGEGGDELFGGYQTHYLYKIAALYRKLPWQVRKIIKRYIEDMKESHDYLSTAYKLKRFTYGAEYNYGEAHYRWKVLFDESDKKHLLSAEFREHTKSDNSFTAIEKYFHRAQQYGLSVAEQLMYVDFKTFLQDDPLQKTDRMSMANSLEVRVPLLDNAIMDFSRNVPLHFKVRGFQTKYLLRKALARFQPGEIAFGKKRGFTPPMALWIKNGLKDYVMSTLSAENIAQIGFLQHNYVAQILNNHMHGRAENSRLIWAIVVLVNWYKNYVV